jgi:glucuronate isomerase
MPIKSNYQIQNPDRFFSTDPGTRALATTLYESIAHLPIISPHGHVDPHLFSNAEATFGSPADLFIIPDHYVTRMLYSQGIPLESLGVSRSDGGEVEKDHRKIWRLFCENFHLFRGTPSGIWLTYELSEVFEIFEKPATNNADGLFDEISEKLALPQFSPRALFKKFNINLLSTTDAPSDNLDDHKAIQASGWDGRIIPTFRPDGVVNLDSPNWRKNIDDLGKVVGIEITDYRTFIRALEERREYFKLMGATATDHACLSPRTEEMSDREASAIFQRALAGKTNAEDVINFTAHMLIEMARMSIEDGLVMQLHPGSLRNHNHSIFSRFGLDKGCDIPVQTEFTRNLQPLLNKYGNDTRLKLILFTLDESVYSRELAPLAGHYPAVKLGPPWWFHDSLNGMARYFDQVMETAGLYNTSGFNDDTRAFCSIPARHDVWRRASANWVAGLVARHQVDMDDGLEMMQALAVGLARDAYNLND